MLRNAKEIQKGPSNERRIKECQRTPILGDKKGYQGIKLGKLRKGHQGIPKNTKGRQEMTRDNRGRKRNARDAKEHQGSLRDAKEFHGKSRNTKMLRNTIRNPKTTKESTETIFLKIRKNILLKVFSRALLLILKRKTGYENGGFSNFVPFASKHCTLNHYISN